MEDFLNQIFFTINETPITVGAVIASCSLAIVAFLFHSYAVKNALKYYTNKGQINELDSQRMKRLIGGCLLLLFLIIAVDIFNFNQILFPNRYFKLSWNALFRGLFIIQLARLTHLFSANFVTKYYTRNLEEDVDNSRLEDVTKDNPNLVAGHSIRLAILLLAIYLFFQNFQFDPTILTLHANTENPISLKISTLIIVLLVFIIGRVFIWALTQLILLGYYQRNKVNLGTQFAINQLISYFIYVLAILTALHFLGINMTVFWGGMAALLVGLGLGLQQTFSDLFSGLLLLFERGIEVGEVLEIDGTVGSLKKIGLRTSVIESRDNRTIIVPNSKLVVNNVINWSHYDDKVRFEIKVGVAYGSDTALVKQILLETARENSFLLKRPGPLVRFNDFGGSSLDFSLLFYSKNFLIIEDVKSDLRFEIDRKFRAANIEIPFPQRDVWIRKNAD